MRNLRFALLIGLCTATAGLAATPVRPALSSVQLLVPPTVVLSPPINPRPGVPFSLLGSATATRGLALLTVDLDGHVSTKRISGIGCSLAGTGIRPTPVGTGIHTLVVEAQDTTGGVGTATMRFRVN